MEGLLGGGPVDDAPLLGGANPVALVSDSPTSGGVAHARLPAPRSSLSRTVGAGPGGGARLHGSRTSAEGPAEQPPPRHPRPPAPRLADPGARHASAHILRTNHNTTATRCVGRGLGRTQPPGEPAPVHADAGPAGRRHPAGPAPARPQPQPQPPPPRQCPGASSREQWRRRGTRVGPNGRKETDPAALIPGRGPGPCGARGVP